MLIEPNTIYQGHTLDLLKEMPDSPEYASISRKRIALEMQQMRLEL